MIQESTLLYVWVTVYMNKARLHSYNSEPISSHLALVEKKKHVIKPKINDLFFLLFLPINDIK